MKPEDVHQIVGDIPYMRLDQARTITSFIQKHGIENILELGFYHGVSTCYLAAAVEGVEGGSVTTIDRRATRALSPSIDQLLDKTGLRNMAHVYFEPRSYNWRLMKMLDENPLPRFDLCYIDGAHQWFDDGFAFFLVDLLLNPGGWIVFDDIDWKASTALMLRNSKRVRRMTKEERKTAQVRKVYELLVKPHPSYGDFRVEDGWAYAHKISTPVNAQPIKKEVVVKSIPFSWHRIRAATRSLPYIITGKPRKEI